MEYPCGGGVSSRSQPSTVFPSIHRKPRASELNQAEARDAAVRSVKKHLRDIVRDDWTYEPSSSSLTNNASSPSPHPSRTFEIKEWRERDPDTSCSDAEGNWAAASCKAVRSPSSSGGAKGDGFARSGGSASPDFTAERRIVERRVKRRKLMEEEMRWNGGLRTFVERRDAWSGARVSRRRRPGALGNASSKAIGDITCDGRGDSGDRDGAEEVEMVDDETCLSSSLPISGTEGTSITTAPDLHDGIAPEPQPRGGEDNAIEDDDDDDDDDPETLIPVFPSIIPLSNPVRASIDSSIYPSIYSKVVLQSLTPTIPINLSDMTKCLVQGWKGDGQWPPQATPQDPLAGKRKPTAGKYSPIGGIIGTGMSGTKKKNQENEPPTPPPTTMRQKRGSGVGETMRKVLSFPLHPFHLRRGSQPQPESPDAIRNS